jgi:hypothetical protein
MPGPDHLTVQLPWNVEVKPLEWSVSFTTGASQCEIWKNACGAAGSYDRAGAGAALEPEAGAGEK